MYEEKRENVRYSVLICPVRCLDIDCANSGVSVNDISLGGIGITTRGRLVKDQKIKLEILIPDDDIPVFVVGEIVWVKKINSRERDSADNEITIQSGIKIIKMNKCDRDRIIYYIKNNFYR
jgi:hypothetical protein